MTSIPARILAVLILATNCLCGSLFADQKFDDLRKAAEQGNAKAMTSLGYAYHFGRVVNKDDVEALKWWSKAAERGDVEAQSSIGNCYINGEGVPKNVAESVKWQRKAALQGYAPAQIALGNIYNASGLVP